MPTFKYKGYKTDGTGATGAVEASGANDAAAKIKAAGVFPSEILMPETLHRKGFFKKRDESFLPEMTRQLAMLLSAGVPLIDALATISDEHRGFNREMLIAIKERISAGAGLHRALEEFSDIFPEFYINMVQAAEAGGSMDIVLLKLADFLERQNTVKTKVRSSLTYPVLMAGVSIVVLSFLFTFVIPKIVRIFKDTKSDLPFITTLLVFITHIFAAYWWALIATAIGGYVYLKKFIRRNTLFVHKALLRLPGNVLQSLYYGRVARALGFLLDSGLPMLRALNLSAGSSGNKAIEASVLNAAEKVAEGQRLSVSMTGFPPVFIRLISAGEKSGSLAEALNRAADSYEEDFSRKVNSLVSVIEPAMILFMGLVIGFIVLAVLLPMFQLNQLIK